MTFDRWHHKEERRKRGDLIEMYKLLTEKENVDYWQFFRKEDNQYMLRGHSCKMFIPSIRTALWKSFFSHRVLDCWNRLPEMVVVADTVQTFKARHDRFSKDMGYSSSPASHHIIYKKKRIMVA